MLNVYLCDDNPVIIDRYQTLLLSIAQKYDLLLNIRSFSNGEQLLFYLENNLQDVHIIFLDIMMNGVDGITTAKKLRSYGCEAEIIFLTANPEYVFDSFDVSPTHYIIKDSISEERFEEIFFKAASLAEKKSLEMFTCENNSVIKQIPISQISYFEIRNRIVSVHYNKDCFEFYSKMEDLERRLKNRNFIRVHRSYLVHLRYIEQINRDSLVLLTKEFIPLGGTYSKNVKLALNRYLNLFQ